jgi:hypothetical protein
MGSFARARKRKESKAVRKGENNAQKAAKVLHDDMARTYAEQVRADIACRKIAISNVGDIFFLTVHERYGFGRQRILQLRNKMQNEFDCIVGGYVTVREIDAFLKEDIKLDSGLSSKYKNMSHYDVIETKAVKEMTAAFLMAMLDEFGYKGEALAKTCHHAFQINDRLAREELTYSEIRQRLQKVMDRGKKAGQK